MIIDRTNDWYERASIYLCDRIGLSYINWLDCREISIFFLGEGGDSVKRYTHREWVSLMWPLYREDGENND